VRNLFSMEKLEAHLHSSDTLSLLLNSAFENF
jgi:hypothetical protein